ncbi:GumC family protein [Aminobacter sp. Piv2-1]|uniref:GumC family protein n=1 Tax=Aminobacter sp. Piv2-1 TaxID=3031122 RepID=UPI00309E4074
MADIGDTDDRQPLRRARDASGKPRGGSLLSVTPSEPDDGQDQAVRHRFARFRREAERAAEADIASSESAPGHELTDRVPDAAADWQAKDSAAAGDGWRSRLARSVAPVAEQIAAIQNMPPPPDAPSLEEQQMRDADPREPMIEPMAIVRGIGRSKLLIGTTTLIGALAGVAIALSTPKMYQAWAEMIVDPRNLKLTERELTDSGLPWDATLTLVENQVRVLTSGSVLTKVVDRLDLANDPEFNGKGIGGGGLRSLLGEVLPSGEAPAAPNGADRAHVLAVNNLFETLTIERGNKSFVVSIGAKTQSAEKSALIANTMTEVFMQTNAEMQAGTAGRAAEELNARLEELRKAVEAAERKVEAFKAENDIIDAQGRLITDDEIQRVNDQLTAARARTLELNARAASTRNVNVESALSGSLPEAVASPAITELRAQYATLTQEADRLSVKLGPRHPERLAAEAQLTGARERIAAELRRIAASIQVELRRAVQTEQELAARLAQLKVRQGEVSNELVTLRELDRDVAAKRAVYESFLLRARETGEQKDINPANITVISRANPPLESTGPRRAVIAVAGSLLGLLAGIGLGGLRGALDGLRETADRRRARVRRRAEGPSQERAPEMGGDVRAVAASAEAAVTSESHAAESEWSRPRSAEADDNDPLASLHSGRGQAAPRAETAAVHRESDRPGYQPAEPTESPSPEHASRSQIDEISESLRELRKELNLLRERRARRYF